MSLYTLIFVQLSNDKASIFSQCENMTLREVSLFCIYNSDFTAEINTLNSILKLFIAHCALCIVHCANMNLHYAEITKEKTFLTKTFLIKRISD
jgi:hypothetical protein